MLVAFLWYCAEVVLVAGYLILDGYDLGIGLLQTFYPKEHGRRVLLNAIGPFWDGNEVWLVTAVGAMFAGFPTIYAVLSTIYYIPILFFILAIVLRIASLELRKQHPYQWWKTLWDYSFQIASWVMIIVVGWILGTLVQGLPVDSDRMVEWHRLSLSFPLATIVWLALYLAQHGALFLRCRTSGPVYQWAEGVIRTLHRVLWIGVVVGTLFVSWIWGAMMALVLWNIRQMTVQKRDILGFVVSSTGILLQVVLAATFTYPALIPTDPMLYHYSLYQNSGSEYGLTMLVLVASVGVPLVLGYTALLYYLFRHRVKIGKDSY